MIVVTVDLLNYLLDTSAGGDRPEKQLFELLISEILSGCTGLEGWYNGFWEGWPTL